MQWYYSKNATQVGPVPDAELRAKIAAGEVTGSDMVWHEGMPDWRPLSAVDELQVAQPAQPAAAGTSPPVPPAVGASPYATPAAPADYAVPPPTSGLAIASFVCGLIGVVTCTLITGIPAVICGHMALKAMRDLSKPVGGRGFAVAGLIMGYVSLLLIVGFMVLMFIGLAVETVKF